MHLTEQLLTVASAYSEKTGTSLSTISTKLFNGGGRLSAIASGGDLNTRNFESAMAWFSENWPKDLDWPAGVGRPRQVERCQ